MKLEASDNLLLLNGKVVQIFEIAGEKVVKIFIEPGSINLTLDKNDDVSLGDLISIEASVPEYRIKSYLQ